MARGWWTMWTGFVCVAILAIGAPAAGELRAGVGKASITPLEENIPTQLGGYGARNGEPAQGVHDTLNAKVVVFEWNGKKSAVVTLDVCSVPICLVEESLKQAAVAGLGTDSVLFIASHTHGGIEGYSMDRRNIANNPHIGIFSEEVLAFVSKRTAQALRDADAALRPVTAASGVVRIEGMNRNRRKDTTINEDLTLLRLDGADGKPYAAFVNFTAHGTIMSEREMLLSGDWSGNMQRTFEALVDGVTCLYSNGAEGDISPRGQKGGSRYEMAEDYGRRIGIAAAKLFGTLKPEPVRAFGAQVRWVQLPARQAAPNFAAITGDEYHVDEQQLKALLEQMFPDKAPLCALRVNGFELVSFPGEPLCVFGLKLKESMRAKGIQHPCVAALTNDEIGYILTAEAYNAGGYEATTSFYGPGLGALLLDAATSLAIETAQAK